MKFNCIYTPGNWFLRNTVTVGTDGTVTLKISADPHDYQKFHCMKLRYDGSGKYDGDWLLGNSYLKFRIWFDGKFIGCGPFRAITNGNRMEHTFAVENVTPGTHTLAIACRCDGEGICATVSGGSSGEWKTFNANEFCSPVCWETPAVYGYYKGDCGPGEYFEHLRGDLYPDNWQMPEFDDSAWQDAVFHEVERPVEYAPFNFEYETVHPQSIKRTADGRFIADFGKERIAALALTGSENGGNVEVRLAEELKDDERILWQMRSHVCYQEIWKFKSGRQQLSHFGLRAFRYAEIAGYNAELAVDDIAMLVVRAPYQPAAQLITDNQYVKQVWDLCENTIRNITCDTFVDCFTRERVAYEADTLLTMGSFFVFNNFTDFLKRHLPFQLNHPTWPQDWAQIIPLLYYEYYMETGDIQTVAGDLDALVEYSSYRHLVKDGMIESFPLEILIDWPRKYRDRYDTGDNRFLSVPNMLACKVAGVIAFLAKEACRSELAEEFSRLHQQMTAAINTRCFNAATGLYVDRPGSENSSLYANMWALYADIVPKELQAKVAEFVADYGMECSLYSGYYYLDVLFRYGYGKLAFEYIAKADSQWQAMLKAGCSVTTEYWIGDVPMMSLAHPWGSYPAHFIAKYVFGLKAVAPGRKTCDPDSSIDFSGTLIWKSQKTVR